ncbi:MAG: hypothetical protein KGJ35_00660 [Patescibacteria group bacterium]|nr:hypothetical protein [Patescibacteria group bacterium]
MTSYKKITAHVVVITVLAVIANVIALVIYRAILPAPATFSPFWYSSVIELTAAGVVAAGIVYYAMALIWRGKLPSRNVNRDYAWLSIILLVLSFVPDLLLPFSTDADNAGATWPVVAALMIMHVIPAVIAIVGFVYLNREQQELASEISSGLGK